MSDDKKVLESFFPRLSKTRYRITSPSDETYNCIAWAAGISDCWWWPKGQYWPSTELVNLSVESFVSAFETLGYKAGADDSFRHEFEKGAIYTIDSEVTQMARQIAPDLWTSKIGKFVDIEHTLDGLHGDWYGAVEIILERKRK